ncbi:class I adenylate-forming enzyme family protein [Xenophilus arseniciresistens]|uniref:Class I adenylate-forming enzyme family protein n=1 Tax=Xenophilus arseniciresistens TaxID=1283306 RepID=A0AAE3N680_9BURK|nr:class I adenylate-forming enzyme family protein [Xenophilus arseniciresistens]MDA7415996.1 class I adenylate-forming enzyme family protein [Xenophilus arseniciresistens]
MLAERIAAQAWYHRSIPDLFDETCRLRGARTALIFEGREISFSDLHAQVQQMAHALLRLGIGKGDVVCTLPSPTPEFAVLYFATLQVGAVVNPLNLLWGRLEFEGVLPRNRPAMIVTVDHYGGRDYIALLKEAIPDLHWDGEGRPSAASLPTLRHLVCLSRGGQRHAGFMDFEALREAGAGAHEPASAAVMEALLAAREPTEIQFICQTSGTTGLSKSALWDHRPPLATVNFGAQAMGFDETECYINLAPFYHNSGLYALNMNLVLCGTPLVLMESFHPKLALELIDRHGCTSTFGFDAHWQAMRRVPDFERYRFTIRKAILAGEPKTYDLVRAMCPPGATINNLYAQTENGPLVSLAQHDCVDYQINKYTHGRPLPGVRVVIKDIETGERVPQGSSGEICYSSPYMFRGYLAQEEATRASYDAEGYFHSGDYGHFDGGYITFLGRLGGVVKSGGENVSTTRVSTLLLEHFADEFDDVKTIGVEDDYWGARVVSFVRAREGCAVRSTAELREACKGHLAAYEIPRDFLAWEGEWPVTAEGKINFKRLTERARQLLAEGAAQ